MTSPSLELQGKIVERLKASAAVTALVGNRVYDQIPATKTFPYISIGPDQSIFDDLDCEKGFEIFIQIDAWSRAVGYPEVKRIADAVFNSLHRYDLPLVDNALVSFEHRQLRTLREPDGLTSHAVIEFVALVEQP